jgi:hypothetical protein
MRGFERGLLRDALVANDWNIEATGRTLGVTGSHIRTRMRLVGGLEELDPKRNKPKVEAEHAEHDDGDLTSEGKDPVSSEPSDLLDGETDRDDDPQERSSN